MAAILVVDGESDPAGSLKQALQEQGYEAEAVPDAVSAYAYVRRQVPDLVVLDLMSEPPSEEGTQPDGLKLLAQLYLDHPRLPVVIWSRSTAYRDLFWSWAAAAHVEKGEGVGPVLKIVREVLGGPTAASLGMA
jgi:CheY-like chemotaxis protein